MVFIDPAGNVIGMQPGELTAEMLTPIVEHWLTQYREGGLLTAGRSISSVSTSGAAASPSPARSSTTPASRPPLRRRLQ